MTIQIQFKVWFTWCVYLKRTCVFQNKIFYIVNCQIVAIHRSHLHDKWPQLRSIRTKDDNEIIKKHGYILCNICNICM